MSVAGGGGLVTAPIRRARTAGMWVTELERDGWREVYLLATAQPGEPPEQLADRVRAALDQSAAVPVRCVIGGGAGAETLPLEPRMTVIDRLAEPGRLHCVRVVAVAGTPVEPLVAAGRRIGAMWEAGGERHVHIVGVTAPDVTAPPRRQAEECFAALEASLAVAGARLHDVVRTWLHAADIDQWYDELNAARNASFQRAGLFSRRLPASTGIGLRHAGGAALALSAWVICGERVRPVAVSSPMQAEPRVYGSAFSRAVEVRSGSLRRLLVSSTSSIDADGRSVGVTVVEQVRHTVEVIDALLRSRRMDWRDVTHLVGFVRRAEDAPAVAELLAELLPETPEVPLVGAELCRPELLFELELEAAAAPLVRQ